MGRAKSKAPHPSPLPEGEGTDWGVLRKCAELMLFNEPTIDPIFEVDVERKTPRSAPSPFGRGLG